MDAQTEQLLIAAIVTIATSVIGYLQLRTNKKVDVVSKKVDVVHEQTNGAANALREENEQLKAANVRASAQLKKKTQGGNG